MRIKRLVGLFLLVTTLAVQGFMPMAYADPNNPTLISENSAGDPMNQSAQEYLVSSDGRYVAIETSASNVDAQLGQDYRQAVYQRDTQTELTTLESVNSDGVAANGDSPVLLGMSGDGRYIYFDAANSTNMGVTVSQGHSVFVRDTVSGTTNFFDPLDSDGQPIYGVSSMSVSQDGDSVAFVALDQSSNPCVYLYNYLTGIATLVADNANLPVNYANTISSDGNVVLYADINNNGQGTVYNTQTGERTPLYSNASDGNYATYLEQLSRNGQYALVTSYDPNFTSSTPSNCQYGGCYYVEKLSDESIYAVSPNIDGRKIWQNNATFLSNDGTKVLFEVPDNYTTGLGLYDLTTDEAYEVGYGANYSLTADDNFAGTPAYLTDDNSEIFFQSSTTAWDVPPLCHDENNNPVECFNTYESSTTESPDHTGPTLGQPSWSVNPVPQGQSTTLTVPVTSSYSSIIHSEYFIGDPQSSDPGVGYATPMTTQAGSLSANLGDSLSPGTYQVSVRAENAGGNWSSATTTNLGVIGNDTAPTITSNNAASTGMRQAFDFQVTTTGDPTASVSESGALPSGLALTDNGDGTADISGVAAAGTAGAYPITITATNGIGDPATQNFTLTVTSVTSAPGFTSDNSDTESYGTAFSFTVTTSGYPAPTVKKTGGTLPQGVTYVDNGDGTGTVSGTPTGNANGNYALKLKAQNSVGSATQTVTLTITKAPVIRKIQTQTAHVGQAYSKNFVVTGYDTPSISLDGNLPAGMAFSDNGDGTATLSGTPSVGTGGSYSFTLNASNSYGNASQTFTFRVLEAPVITSASSTSVAEGSPFSFQVTSTGYPAPTVTKSGTLPAGIAWHGTTDTFSGTPHTGSAGTYPITVTAKNGSGTVTQNFSIVVTH